MRGCVSSSDGPRAACLGCSCSSVTARRPVQWGIRVLKHNAFALVVSNSSRGEGLGEQVCFPLKFFKWETFKRLMSQMLCMCECLSHFSHPDTIPNTHKLKEERLILAHSDRGAQKQHGWEGWGGKLLTLESTGDREFTGGAGKGTLKAPGHAHCVPALSGQTPPPNSKSAISLHHPITFRKPHQGAHEAPGHS